MKILATAALALGLVSLPSVAGSSWGDGSGDLVPGDGGKPLIVDPWVGERYDDVIKLDDPWIIIDIGPSEEDEGIIFEDDLPFLYNGPDRSWGLNQR